MKKMVPRDLIRVQITKISVYLFYPLYFFHPPGPYMLRLFFWQSVGFVVMQARVSSPGVIGRGQNVFCNARKLPLSLCGSFPCPGGSGRLRQAPAGSGRLRQAPGCSLEFFTSADRSLRTCSSGPLAARPPVRIVLFQTDCLLSRVDKGRAARDGAPGARRIDEAVKMQIMA